PLVSAPAADALAPSARNPVTDVRGFGLFGHGYEMSERSGVRIVLDDVPALPGALEAARDGVRTGGDRRNREFAPIEADGAPDDVLAVGYDAQTAGGLLASLPADKAFSLAAEFRARELYLARVGAVEAGSGLAPRA